MPSSLERAKAALSAALRRTLVEGQARDLVGGTHTRRFADNLLPDFSSRHIAVLRDQLERGAGGELRATRTGKRPAHAPYSSATLAVNAFGAWLGHEEQLRVDGLGGFSTVAIESRHRIDRGGGTANLDALLRRGKLVVGVESKLTEPLAVHEPVKWSAAYQDPAMAALLSDGWRDVFDASKAGKWKPRHLGLEQLIKHALALESCFKSHELHLVYVWWEPRNPGALDELAEHRTEVEELKRRVGDSRLRLHATTYPHLFGEWAALEVAGVGGLLEQLAARYSISVPDAGSATEATP